MNQPATLPTLRLKKGKEASLRRRHPWIFSGAVAQQPEGLQDGEVVAVHAHDGGYLATGHFQRGSILVRAFSFEKGEPDAEFWRARVAAAWRRRQALGFPREGTNCFRLIHGEGDDLPGLVVDFYNGVAVVQAHSVGMFRLRETFAGALRDLPALNVRAVFDRSRSTLKLEEEPGNNDFLWGDSEAAWVTEHHLKFRVDFVQGQKTGFFLDQRENRALLRQYAGGRRVLNTFAYTGGFSVYALAGGAEFVESIEISEAAVEALRENVAQNFPDAAHRSVAGDAFRHLSQLEAGTFDLIVLDPPAFAKHPRARRNALQAYARINADAFRKIERGGILFTFSCSQVISAADFRTAIFTAAQRADRSVRVLHQLSQPADHPVSIFHPEGEYLKGLVVWVE